MNNSVVYFTDRTPSDKDPFSFWIWEELKERARAGSDVFIYLINVEEADFPDDLHPRIHLRSALKKRILWRWGPFIQGLISIQASAIWLIEPKSPSVNLWPLISIPNMKHLGLLSAQISALLFSSEVQKGLPLQIWLNSCDLISYTHPQFKRNNSLKNSQRIEQIIIDPEVFPKNSHWSLESSENLAVIPGSLADLIDPQGFLTRALDSVTKNPDQSFIFLNGLGNASLDLKRLFLAHSLASHFLFPEDLNSAQKGTALFKAREVLAKEVHSHSSLAGLSLQLILDKQQRSLEEKRVYGLL